VHRIERRLVAGVTGFVGEGAGPYMGGLMFRVGRADESGPTSGMTHLVEHLALPAQSRREPELAASVDNILVTFFAQGEPDEVGGLLSHAATTLRALPLERLATERAILAAEQSAQGFNANRLAFSLRFGPVGHGLVGYDEWGLEHLAPEDVQAWADARFTRGNAAVWFSGEPPDAFGLDLPDGERIAPPPPRPISYVDYPALYAASAPGGVLLTMVAQRSTALAMVLDVLEHRLADRLRYELGLVYSVESVRSPLTKDETHVAVVADASETAVRRVAAEAVAVLRRLAEEGPTEDELEHERRLRRRDASAATELPSFLGFSAAQHLLGAPFESVEDLVAEGDGVTAEQVAEALRQAADRLLVVAPEEASELAGLAPYPLTSPRRVEGRRFRPQAIVGSARKASLVVGDEGVTIQAPDGSGITALFADCALVVRDSEGSRLLVSDDGFFVPVDPTDWRKGKEAVALIDAAVDPALVVAGDPELERRREQVDRVAAACVPDLRWVGDELRALPGVLEDDEELLLVARASRSWRLGMAVLTERRLFFLYVDEVKAEVPVEQIRSASATAGKEPDLELDTDHELRKLSSIAPAEMAERFVELLSRPGSP
jgi:zinc protease